MRVHPKIRQIQVPLKIFRIIERKVLLVKRGPFGIKDVGLKSVYEQVQFKSERKHCPVLPAEKCIKRLSITHIVHIFRCKRIYCPECDGFHKVLFSFFHLSALVSTAHDGIFSIVLAPLPIV